METEKSAEVVKEEASDASDPPSLPPAKPQPPVKNEKSPEKLAEAVDQQKSSNVEKETATPTRV
jgi:hypothetical protein